MLKLNGRPLIREDWEFFKPMSCWGLKIVIILHERGIPSKHMSSTCIEYVSGLCTHRPSLLPIDCFDEYWGVLMDLFIKMNHFKSLQLEEAKVVTRYL